MVIFSFATFNITKILISMMFIGGRINANTKVVQVLWGAGNYDTHVSSTSTPSMASFFEQVLSNGALTSWCK